MVTREGALVRFLRAAPKNPLVMSPVEREQVGHAFGQLAGRLQAGQSIQFYVEALPIRLDALLERSQEEAERTIRALASDGDASRRVARGCTRRCASRLSATPTSRPPSTSPTTSSFPTCPTRATGWTGGRCCQARAGDSGPRRWSGHSRRTAASRASRCT